MRTQKVDGADACQLCSRQGIADSISPGTVYRYLHAAEIKKYIGQYSVAAKLYNDNGPVPGGMMHYGGTYDVDRQEGAFSA